MQIGSGSEVGRYLVSHADVSLPAREKFALPAEYPLSNIPLQRPERLLSPWDGLQPLASIRTIHASTLFSGGAVIDGEVNPSVRHDFARARAQGITAMYVVGMWEPTAFSALWTRHWAPTWQDYHTLKPGWIGASTFSTDSYVPNRLVGSWQNLDKVLECAHREQVQIIPCFVTNTIGMGGSLMREVLRTSPESIMTRSVDRDELARFRDFIDRNAPVRTYTMHRDDGPSPGGHTLELFHLSWQHDLYRYQYSAPDGENLQAFLQIHDRVYRHAWIVDRPHAGASEQVHCIQLGSEDPFDRGDGSATVWTDTVHRSVHLSQTRRQQVQELEPVLNRFPHIRCDMAHLAGVDAWKEYPAFAREQGHTAQGMLLETYFDHEHLLNQDPAISVYANFLFNWLVREDMNVSAVMWHVHEQRDMYSNHRLIAYVENHDDKGSTYLPMKGAQALIIAACPVQSVLWGQNQRLGDEFRIAAQLHVPREDFNRRQLDLLRGTEGQPFDRSHFNYFDFFRRVERLAALPVFRSPESAWHPAVFHGIPPQESSGIFHIVRHLPEDQIRLAERVLVVVDARKHSAGLPLVIDVADSFKVAVEELPRYAAVDLISGEIREASEQLVLKPEEGSPEPHSYVFALVERSLLNG